MNLFAWWRPAAPELDAPLRRRLAMLPGPAPLGVCSLREQRWVVLDLETSGLNLNRDQVLSIGAVAIEDGLITPVIKNAHLKGIAHIGREVRELAARGREKRLMPDEYTGSTFSVSNLGMLGIHEFTAIINPPEAGILAIGGVVDTPVAVGGQVVVRPRMRITMSCDHRVIDGAYGARFASELKKHLEDPELMLVERD